MQQNQLLRSSLSPMLLEVFEQLVLSKSMKLGPDSQVVKAGGSPLVPHSNPFAIVYEKESLSPSTKITECYGL